MASSNWMTDRRYCNNILFYQMYLKMILPVNQSEHATKRQGEWEGEADLCVELILPSGEIPMTAHSSKPIMVVPQPNIDALISVKSGGREEPQNETEKP